MHENLNELVYCGDLRGEDARKGGTDMHIKELLKELGKPFPPEAFEVDDSRGFELVGIKGAYVIERLNEVFGPCGSGWAYTVKRAELMDDWMMVDIELRYCINGEWSEPILAFGDCRVVRGRLGDARKGALSDALKKAASLLGVGNEAYKGLLRTQEQRQGQDNVAARVVAMKARMRGPESARDEEVAQDSPKALTGISSSERAHPWHLCTDLINRARREIPYYEDNVPHILNTLRKLEAEGVIIWDSTSVDEVFEALNEYAHKRANEKASKD
jgi:hypothetical protein